MVLEFLKTLAQSVYIHLCFFKKKWMFSFGLWSPVFPSVHGYFIVNPALALLLAALRSTQERCLRGHESDLIFVKKAIFGVESSPPLVR